MDERSVKLLIDWGFLAYVQSFKDNEIDYEGLMSITRETAKQLFNGKLGPVDKLERKIRERMEFGVTELKEERPVSVNDEPGGESAFPIKMEEIDLGVSDWKETALTQIPNFQWDDQQLLPKHQLPVPHVQEKSLILLKISDEKDNTQKVTTVFEPLQAKEPLKPYHGSTQPFILNQKRTNFNVLGDLVSIEKQRQHTNGTEAECDDTSTAQAGCSGLQSWRVLSHGINSHQLGPQPSHHRLANLHSKVTPERSIPKMERLRNRSEFLGENVVEIYLQKTCVGNGILNLNRNKLLDARTRVKLCHEIVVNEVGLRGTNVIGRHRFEVLAECIVDLFSREIKATYYVPRIPASNIRKAVQPKGILYDKYHNLLKFLRQTGLRSFIQQEHSSADDLHDPSLPNVVKHVEWLEKQYTQSQAIASYKWKETVQWRIDYLRNSEDNVTKAKIGTGNIDMYFDKFKCLSQPWGISLLLGDFEYLYGSKTTSVVDNWPTIYAKLLLLANKTDIDIQLSETVKTLQLIPRLFNQPLIWSGSKQNKTTWKPNAAESREGFLLHVKAMSALEAELERLRGKCHAVKKQLQPFPLVVGSTTSDITESFVILGDKRILMESPLSAFDTCFKMYHALHSYYPCQSSYSWLFVQQALYNFTTPWDVTPPSVITKVKEFKEIIL